MTRRGDVDCHVDIKLMSSWKSLQNETIPPNPKTAPKWRIL